MSTRVEHANGGGDAKFIERIDPEDPEYRRELQRPADVKEDMRQMESRQRVSSILNSQAFREELESIIADQMKHGPHPSSLIALQQISELLLPNTNSRWQQVSNMGKITNAAEFGGGNVLIPINDIRGIDTLNYAKGERILRCKLASLFRILDLYGWTSGISNHVTIRVSQDPAEHFLVNPYGLLYHEISASSLIKVNSLGGVVEQGSSTYGVNKASFGLHSAIYKARPDIKCIVHVHTHTVTAVSSMKCGLLPISQEAILCGVVSYHEYRGIQAEEDVRKLLAEDLGPISKVLFLRNHGVIACGETIEEACHYLFNVMAACEIQSRALLGGLDNVHIPSAETQRKFVELAQAQNETVTTLENKKWKVGELEFEALMRCLDNAGYRTGYIYRQPVMRSIDRNAVKEVEIPPAATSHGFDPEYVRKLKEEKQKNMKGEWLASPNAYTKTETSDNSSGLTPNPKLVTKWVPENSPNKTSTPIRIENKNQFAPQGVDPRELKNHQKQIKQDRFVDKKTPGYQSRILENIHGDEKEEEEAPKVKSRYYQDTVDAGPESKIFFPRSDEIKKKENGEVVYPTTGLTGSSTVIYGAASKGIIRRDQQNNPHVYKTFMASSNPFQQMDPQELERYKKEVAQKQIRDQEKANKSEIIQSESNGSKKKSHTIPRSKSLLDKKNERVPDHVKSNSGGSQTSTPQSSRASSPDRSPKDKSNNSASQTPSKSTENANKSATMPPGSSAEKQKSDKPKKKSKLSFLSRKKNKE